MNDQPSNVANMVPGPPVGSFVKVSRHGEALWLEVKQVRPGQKIVAVVSNAPLCWPEAQGDAVEVAYDEVIAWMPRADALQHGTEAYAGGDKEIEGWPTERPEPRAHLMRLDGAVGPMEFAAGMRRINERYARQPKIRRRLAVANLCEVLRSLGYHEGVGAFLEAEGDG